MKLLNSVQTICESLIRFTRKKHIKFFSNILKKNKNYFSINLEKKIK